MAISTVDSHVPVVLHHDHGTRNVADFDRLVDKARAAQTLGLDFTLSTINDGHGGRRCLDLQVSVSSEHVQAQQVTERGLSAARLALVQGNTRAAHNRAVERDEAAFEKALIEHTAEAIADLTGAVR